MDTTSAGAGHGCPAIDITRTCLRSLLVVLVGLAGVARAEASASVDADSRVTVVASLWPADEPTNDFGEMDIDELMAVDLAVTSIAGVEQDWFTTPAAVTVLEREDLRRTGHRSLAEALRLAPGVHVMQLSPRTWSISTRGFTGLFANKQLMLIDGRKVYDPLFAGVLWDVQDVLFEDVDRIEVIRGPGASLWGANAVNGVINVVTRSARDTQGWYAAGGGGTHERAFGEVRYGGTIDDSTWFRVWTKYHDHAAYETSTGSDGSFDWDMLRGGVRLDREGDAGYTLTLQSDGYHSDRLGENFPEAVPAPPFVNIQRDDGMAAGGNVLGRVSHEDGDSGWSLQGYYDYTDRVGFDGFEATRHTANLRWRHRFQLGDRQQLLWGLGYEFTTDRTDPSSTLFLDPGSRSDHLFSGFVQNTITIVPDRLFAMVGTKLEHNDYSGFEVQPSARLWWTPTERWMVWGAVSRPVRTPARVEEDINLLTAFVPGPTAVRLLGNDDLESERVLVYEVGARWRPTDTLLLDATGFYNRYHDIITYNRFTVGRIDNLADAESFGLELSAEWQVSPAWSLTANYAFIETDVVPDNVDALGKAFRNQFHLRSSYEITDDLRFNAAMYYTDNRSDGGVSAHVRVDAGLTWRVNEHFEVSAWGQNLFDPSHVEAADPPFTGEVNRIPHSFYVQGTLRF